MGALQQLRDVIGRAEATWSDEDFAELAAHAREIEARRTGFYEMTPEEEAAVLDGLAQADRGEFATEEEIASDRRRYGLR
jgi:predicted transcriptional regulator